MNTQETIFDGMAVTMTQCKESLENYFNTIMNGWDIEPKHEHTINHLATYFIRVRERGF